MPGHRHPALLYGETPKIRTQKYLCIRKCGRAMTLPHDLRPGSYFLLLTAFFSSTPGVNLATRRAAILITPPVCGLRPLRALRCETENVPKPTRVTRSPFFSALVTALINVSMAAAALVLL